MKQMSILTDTTRCIGCEACVEACRKTNRTGEERPWRWQKQIDDLSAARWTTIVTRPGKRFVRRQCRHCLEPACVSVCPVGAMHKTPEGPVVYDPAICMGCRYCMVACPYGIPRYTWSEPVAYVRKCILCYDKIRSGELAQPACTAACPTRATIYGERQDLIATAKEQIAGNPGRYVDRVFGEHEVGGTSVLYISDMDLGFLGWKRDLGDRPLPESTWAILRSVPYTFVGVGAAMAGVYWIIERRMKRQAEEAKKNPPPAKEDDGESEKSEDESGEAKE